MLGDGGIWPIPRIDAYYRPYVYFQSSRVFAFSPPQSPILLLNILQSPILLSNKHPPILPGSVSLSDDSSFFFTQFLLCIFLLPLPFPFLLFIPFLPLLPLHSSSLSFLLHHRPINVLSIYANDRKLLGTMYIDTYEQVLQL